MQAEPVELVGDPAAITPAWVTRVLRRAGLLERASVEDLESRAVGTGQMGLSVRYTLHYDRNEERAPRSVVCKLPSPDPTSRATALAMRSYEAEVRFYRDLVRSVDIRTPACHFADIDLATGDFVLVLEDLAPCEQGDQLAGCSVDRAALAMEELARLHAPRWGDPRLADYDWLNRNTPATVEVMAGLMDAIIPGFLARYGSRLAPDHLRVAERLVSCVGSWMRGHEGPFTVQHADYRLDNMLFATSQGGYALAVVDWQTVVYGPPLSDASYFLGAGLLPHARREHERKLLKLYYDALRARGVTGFSWERCWNQYRRYAFSGLLMAIGASMMVVQTERGDEMFLTMASRHAEQILDLDAEDFLGT
jgi:aminoglycoside/choline kinase family phosphotransferase